MVLDFDSYNSVILGSNMIRYSGSPSLVNMSSLFGWLLCERLDMLVNEADTVHYDDGVKSHLTDVKCCHIPPKVAQLGFMYVNEDDTVYWWWGWITPNRCTMLPHSTQNRTIRFHTCYRRAYNTKSLSYRHLCKSAHF